MQSMQSTQSTQSPRHRVLRFEFSSTMIELTKAFTEVHRYDDRKTYKAAWTAWLAHDEIAAILKSEVERLTDLGYNGDVADKLFKSVRYYFRGATSAIGTSRTPNDANGVRRGVGPKALNALNQGSLHADTKPLGVRDVPIALVAPRKYVLINRDLLDVMDNHIACGLRRDDAYTPARGFAEFCKLNVHSYCSEVTRLSEIMPTGEAVHDKLKKTYKNRYFMIVNAGH
jgi:hypothetical protein